MADGDMSGAEERFREAIQLFADFPEALANLGFLLDQRDDTEAEACLRRALELSPEQPETVLNLGALLARQRREDEAEALYRNALHLQSDAPSILSNLGALLACQRRDAEAEACYRTALRASPDHRSARFNLSYLLLRQGRFEEGWACLEARGWYAGYESSLGCARWQGESLAGKAILIVCEAGQGDMIQFCRYARELKDRGAARVDVLCHPSLKRLFATLDGADRIFALGDPWAGEAWDYWSPPLSLPHFCDTRMSSIPARIPYLRALPTEIETWKGRVPNDGFRVGLVWKGNPKFENDAQRSIPHAAMLTPLWSVPGVNFVSLQKGAGETELRTILPACPIAELGPQLTDFADTAALVANLDLVISVDTAVAHLAGALGKPCWLLLPDYKTDWRWLDERDDSPWYPGTMRLFRQQAGEDWRPVLVRVEKALAELVFSSAGDQAGMR